jgi:transposase
MRTSQKTPETIITIGLDLGKNTFHLVGLDKRGGIVLQQKVSRGQLELALTEAQPSALLSQLLTSAWFFGTQAPEPRPTLA